MPLESVSAGERQGKHDDSRATDDDVVDRDEDELHGVPDETHDAEANRAGNCDLLELLRVGLCAPLDEAARIHTELVSALDTVPYRVVLIGEEWHGRQPGRHGVDKETPSKIR